VVFQNAQADLLVLAKYGVTWTDFRQIEDTLCAHALLWSDWPHDLAFLASLYGQYPKLKHLATTDPYLYLHGDLLATADAWQALTGELDRDPEVARIYREWLLPLIPQFVRATQLGLRVDQEMARRALADLEARQREATHRAQAWCGYPVNLASPVQLLRHWHTFDRLTVPKCDLETLHRWAAKAPDNALLQARRQWAETEGFRRYVMAVVGQETVHPEFLPTQATGRISVTNPPLVNFPDDGKAIKRGLPPLQAIFRPHPGHWWLCWDWSALHARIMAAACGDEEDLRAFREGLDIHLITACRVFRLPFPPNLTDPDHPDNAEWRAQVGWQPKDRRRHLVKTVRYALLNGLSAKAVRESKEAIEQGIDLDELERVGRQFLAAKPAMGRWKAQYVAQALRAGEARSLYGRKRRLLGSSEGGSEERQKAAISGFLQMTEVDILESTLARIFRADPDARLVYPSHDGVKLEYPDRRDPREVWQRWRPWVERPHNFGLHAIACPAEWSVVYDDGRRERLSENGDH
jgi:DNA polymerase-1